MERETEQFEKLMASAGREIRLPEAEKAAVQRRLLAYMEAHPPRRRWFAALAAALTARPVFSGAIATAAFVLVAGLAAARGALPGELLYPVKIAVFEAVPRLLARTDEARLKWEALLAERRLAEAEVLASSGALDAERAVAISRTVEGHASRIEQWARRTEAQQRELAAVNDTLVRLRALTNEQTIARLKIQTAKADADINQAAEDAASAARAKLGTIRAQIQRAYPVSAPRAKEAVRMEANLTIAERALANGGAKLEMKNQREAIVLFEEASRIAQDLEAALATATPAAATSTPAEMPSAPATSTGNPIHGN